MEKFEEIREVIGQMTFESLPSEDPQNDEIRQNICNLLSLSEDGYCLVQWPESQQYMEEEWFEEEAILNINQPSAYFIPIKRLL